jgi:hypothetical protein
MASYLILTPPGGAERNREKTRFIRDGFSFAAFIFPVLWFLWHHLWFHAIAALLVLVVGFELLSIPGCWPGGIAVLFGMHLLSALEGRNLLFSTLASKGWNREGLISAPQLATAEYIYFANTEFPEKQDIPVTKWDMPARRNEPAGRTGAALGLIGYDGDN